MIHKILSALFITQQVLSSDGNPSRILLQAPPVNTPNIRVTPPGQTVPTTPVTTTPIVIPPNIIITPNPTAPIISTQPNAINTIAPIITPNPTTTQAPVIPVRVTHPPTTPHPTTAQPTTRPPTSNPTTGSPSKSPTAYPSIPPSVSPTDNPSMTPTAYPTMNPLPSGFEYGSWGQACPIPGTSRDCELIGDYKLSDAQGYANCGQPGDCCLCKSIICGGVNTPNQVGCDTFTAGDYSVMGVQQIGIIGDPNSATGGAKIECSGIDSCAMSHIYADAAGYLMCNTQGSCANAAVQIDNPTDYFRIDCNGPGSCLGLQLTLNIGMEPPAGMACNPDLRGTTIFPFGGIKCNSMDACRDMDIIINNRGCDKVIMENLECLQQDSCTGANFRFIGDIDITNCACGPSCNFATGLEKCFTNLERLLCPDAQSCMGMVKSIENPLNRFYMECGSELSCAGAQFTINLTPFARRTIRVLEAFKFGGENSGREIVVTINNQQNEFVIIERLECSGTHSCLDATFITGDTVLIEQVICASFEACLGCRIKSNAADPGRACDPEAPLFLQTVGPVVPVSSTQQPLQPNPFVPAPPQGPSPFVPIAAV